MSNQSFRFRIVMDCVCGKPSCRRMYLMSNGEFSEKEDIEIMLFGDNEVASKVAKSISSEIANAGKRIIVQKVSIN